MLDWHLGLFNDKVRFSAEWFNRETVDMLLDVPIPPSLGYDVAPIANVGSATNKGFEFTLGYRRNTGAFQWSVDGNLSTVKNELTSLGIGNSIFRPNFEGNPVSYTEVGQPIAYFYGWVMDGIFQEGDDTSSEPNASPGDIRFKDIAGRPDENGNPTGPDGVIDANDRTNIGHFLPDFTYGLNFTANWKNFDLTMFIQGVSGNEILNTNLYDLEGMTRLFNAGDPSVGSLDSDKYRYQCASGRHGGQTTMPGFLHALLRTDHTCGSKTWQLVTTFRSPGLKTLHPALLEALGFMSLPTIC